MAKSRELSFVDRHTEKVVLLAALCVLSLAVARWGLATPREVNVVEVKTRGGRNDRLSVSQKPVSPEQADSTLLAATNKLEQMINDVTPEPYDPPVWPQTLAHRWGRPLPSSLESFDFSSPRRRGYETTAPPKPIEPPKLEDLLAAMPKPSAPGLWLGVEIPDRQPIEEIPTLRAAAWYDWEELKRAWRGNLIGTDLRENLRIRALRYEIEVQQRLPGGEWRPAGDVTFDRLGGDPKLKTIPDFNGANQTDVLSAVEDYYYRGSMISMLHPKYYKIWTLGGEQSWDVHFPEEVLRAYYTFAEETSEQPETPTVEDTTPTTFVDAEEPAFEEPGEVDGGGVAPGEPKVLLDIPDPKDQEEMGRWLSWGHACGLQFGREYRCRIRYAFVNPLLTWDEVVHADHKADAAVLEVLTPWSNWSTPKSVQQEMKFFVTGANPNREELTVTVFARCLGQWVKAPFKVTAGGSIGGQSDVKVTNLASRKLESRKVRFFTGAIAVELDFKKKVATAAGITRETAEMVYLDIDGALHSRTRYFDENNPTYKDKLLKLAEMTERGELPPAESIPERVKPNVRRPSIGSPASPEDSAGPNVSDPQRQEELQRRQEEERRRREREMEERERTEEQR